MVVCAVAAGCADTASSGSESAIDGRHAPVALSRVGPVGPERHTGPQGRVGQFVVECVYSHSGPHDPIVHLGRHGASHRHDFYGAVATGANSTPKQLATQATTCDKESDTAAYWHPTLYDHDVAVLPRSIAAYYRAAPEMDPTRVKPFPFGLAMIAGDADARAPQLDGGVGWVCGVSTDLQFAPPDCPASAPLHLQLTFPDCWDGRHLDSADHRSHLAYSTGGRCPSSRAVVVPQLMVSVNFGVSGPDHDLRLASGSVTTAHGDFLNAWDPPGLAREVEACIHREVVCELASNREEEPLFQVR